MSDPSSHIKISDEVRKQIKQLAMPLVSDSAKKIADASNDQSSWGFYWAQADDTSAAVTVALHPDAAADNARANRILRNVDAGRVR